ncbi:MAG: YtxH domain-containing protein [Candidatus Omnitrophica bacterium]|nr:YtxH domain-containing protein [Candidatus Omnitrophota bacterium]
MAERRGSGVGRAVGAFALGATLGSIVALLFAPADGRTTRRQIGLKVRELQSGAKQLQRNATRKIRDARTWVMDHMPNGHAKRPLRRKTVHA